MCMCRLSTKNVIFGSCKQVLIKTEIKEKCSGEKLTYSVLRCYYHVSLSYLRLCFLMNFLNTTFTWFTRQKAERLPCRLGAWSPEHPSPLAAQGTTVSVPSRASDRQEEGGPLLLTSCFHTHGSISYTFLITSPLSLAVGLRSLSICL